MEARELSNTTHSRQLYCTDRNYRSRPIYETLQTEIVIILLTHFALYRHPSLQAYCADRALDRLRNLLYTLAAMAQYYPQQQPYGAQASPQNLQFYPSSYTSVSGHTTPSQATYGGFGGPSGSTAQAYPVGGVGSGYGGFGSPAAGVSGRMGEQGGLRTGWLAAFGTEGYEGEPPLLEELGVNFEHIRTKVGNRLSDGLLSGCARNGVVVSVVSVFRWIEADSFLFTDIDGAQSLCSDRSASDGRQRSVRGPPLHRALRDIPASLGQGLLRLHLRRCRLRHCRPASDSQSHVARSRYRVCAQCRRPVQLRPPSQAYHVRRFVCGTFLRHSDVSPVSQRPRLLLPALGFDQSGGNSDPDGYAVRVLVNDGRGRLVHV